MFCNQCGSQNPDDSKFCYHCGAALPAPGELPPVEPVAAPVAPAPAPVAPAVPAVLYAGFWRRFLAHVIDSLILSIPTGILFLLFILPTVTGIVSAARNDNDVDALVSIVLSTVFGWIWVGLMIALVRLAYWTVFECSQFQATPGKMALGIVVTDAEGRRISLPRSLARNLGKVLSHLILHIGFIMAGLTQKKQALHDMLADCLVVMR
jgi:uncharacterized RDD family membrane protein YckC